MQVDLFLASKFKNSFMSAVDLCPSNKVFIEKVLKVSYETTTEIDDSYFFNLIEESKSKKEFWVPIVLANNEFFVDRDIQIFSMGRKEYFLNERICKRKNKE